MDTTFWGPSGWKLFHSIAYHYKPEHKQTHILFWKSLPYILPCIYCRRSLTQYINELPIEPYLNNSMQLSYWLYLIHNKVNEKLRSQGLNDKPDPTFNEVYNRYSKMPVQFSNCEKMPGWKFLYCIAHNVPSNLLKLELPRAIQYRIFFLTLPMVIPFSPQKQLIMQYQAHNPIQLIEYNKIKDWVFNMELYIRNNLNQQCPKQVDRDSYIIKYKSGCKGKDEKPTCRVKK